MMLRNHQIILIEVNLVRKHERICGIFLHLLTSALYCPKQNGYADHLQGRTVKFYRDGGRLLEKKGTTSRRVKKQTRRDLFFGPAGKLFLRFKIPTLAAETAFAR